jgi:hypothetical protein
MKRLIVILSALLFATAAWAICPLLYYKLSAARSRGARHLQRNIRNNYIYGWYRSGRGIV